MTALIRCVATPIFPVVLELWQLAYAEPTQTDDLEPSGRFKHDPA
jgi:hypothetical protein